MTVTVLGAGSRGATVAALLCRRDHDVLLWARNPEVAGEVNDQRQPRLRRQNAWSSRRPRQPRR